MKQADIHSRRRLPMLNLPIKAIDIFVFHWLLLQHGGGGGGCLNMEPVVSYPSFDCRIWSHWRRWYAITRLSWPCFTITPRSRGRGLASCLAWCLVALVVKEPGVWSLSGEDCLTNILLASTSWSSIFWYWICHNLLRGPNLYSAMCSSIQPRPGSHSCWRGGW